MDLRQNARGKHCTLRLPDCCSHDPEKTVLCHIRHASIAGMGQKPVDLCAVWGCNNCHGMIDGRASYDWEANDITWEEAVLSALLRTLSAYDREGLCLIP